MRDGEEGKSAVDDGREMMVMWKRLVESRCLRAEVPTLPLAWSYD